MAVRGRETFAKFRTVINFVSGVYRLMPLKLRKSLFEMHRNTRGKIGLGLRYAILKATAYECGENVAVYPGAYMFNIENLSVGSNVSIHPMCYIECGNKKGAVTIKDDVSLAHGTTLMSTSHIYDGLDTPIKDKGVFCEPVCIENNVWIGSKVTVTAGTTIASGCVIGANAVVTKDTEKNGVYAGVPARKIKSRQ